MTMRWPPLTHDGVRADATSQALEPTPTPPVALGAVVAGKYRVDRVIGHNFTGQWVDEVHAGDPNLPALLEDYRATVSGPTWRRGPPRVRHDDKCSTLEVLRVPLATDAKTVDMILALTLFFDHRGDEI